MERHRTSDGCLSRGSILLQEFYHFPLNPWRRGPRSPLLAAGTFSLASVWSDCYSAAMPDGQSGVNTSPTEALDDRALLRAVAARDKDALQQLYARHSAALFALALKILSDRAEAEDVLQEAFVQIWKTAGSFDEDRGKPMGWLIVLTRSRAIDRLRSRKTRARFAESVACGFHVSHYILSPSSISLSAFSRSVFLRAVPW